jgi:hypothetical protein
MCADAEDRAVKFESTSYIRFSARNRPQRYLVLYLHFKPTSPNGELLRRSRKCHNVFDDAEEDKVSCF